MSNAQSQLKTTVKPVTTTSIISHVDIAEFIAGQIEAPALNYTPIDTSYIELNQFVEDSDIKRAFFEAGIIETRVVDEYGAIVPNARLISVNKDGSEDSIVPFFPYLLLVNQAKLELKLPSQRKAWAAGGGMKAKGSFKFVVTPDQLDAMQAKSKMILDQEVKELTAKFLSWLGSYTPTSETLQIVYDAFIAGASLVTLGNDCYIRQVIKTDDASNVQPLTSDNLLLVSSTPDTIGDLILSTCYTFKLVA